MVLNENNHVMVKRLVFLHRDSQQKDQEFELWQESDGTRRLFELAPGLFKAVNFNGANMPKSNQRRPYKRGAPHRDARLFIIVAEGEREDADTSPTIAYPDFLQTKSYQLAQKMLEVLGNNWNVK